MNRAVIPITQAAIAAQLEAFSDQGLEPLRTGDLRGSAAVRCLDVPALLINTRADVSILASTALTLAQRVSAFLDVASLVPKGTTNVQEALASVAAMATEVVALVDAVASHPSVMRDSVPGESSS